MNEEVSIEHEGKSYSAEYVINGDTLTIYLPDGNSISTELRGLKAEIAAKVHLRGYIKQNT